MGVVKGALAIGGRDGSYHGYCDQPWITTESMFVTRSFIYIYIESFEFGYNLK
jgi:hypothetical protein